VKKHVPPGRKQGVGNLCFPLKGQPRSERGLQPGGVRLLSVERCPWLNRHLSSGLREKLRSNTPDDCRCPEAQFLTTRFLAAPDDAPAADFEMGATPKR
jgi:hypothetical protein